MSDLVVGSASPPTADVPMSAGKNPLSLAVVRHVTVRRNARGWTAEQLAQRLSAVGRAVPRTGLGVLSGQGVRRVDVDDLAALAKVFDVANPWDLTGPPACGACGGSPPPGFTCNGCGAGSVTG